MDVPEAALEKKPVFIKGNMLLSYCRRGEGDCLLRQDEVERYIRDRSIATNPAYSQDYERIPHTSLDDLAPSSLAKFRNYLSSSSMGKMLVRDDNKTMLTRLGAYYKDRETGEEGLTLAGLLMLGQDDAILHFFPGFQFDYFEYLNPGDITTRWSDRLTNDGSVSPGNLFEFFFSVLFRVTEGLKRPFRLNSELRREDDSSAHIAVREALANAIIHADFSLPFGIKIERDEYGLRFINPGRLLVSRDSLFSEQLMISICRNKCLQRMFYAMGVVDKAGSGVSKIVRGWFEDRMSLPGVEQMNEPDRVVWTLTYVSIIPEQRLKDVRRSIGVSVYEELPLVDKMILLSVDNSRYLSHNEILSMVNLPLHPSDLSDHLSTLAERGFLVKRGNGRATKYRLSESASPAQHGEAPDEGTPSPPISYPTHLPSHLRELAALPYVKAIAESNWVREEAFENALRDLCKDRWLSISELSLLLRRNTKTLRRILRPMINHGILAISHPERIQHPQQSYRTISSDR